MCRHLDSRKVRVNIYAWRLELSYNRPSVKRVTCIVNGDLYYSSRAANSSLRLPWKLAISAWSDRGRKLRKSLASWDCSSISGEGIALLTIVQVVGREELWSRLPRPNAPLSRQTFHKYAVSLLRFTGKAAMKLINPNH